MSSANSKSLTSFANSDAFYFLLCADARTSNTMLYNSGGSGHLCLVPDSRGKSLSFSPLRMMLTVGLSLSNQTKRNKRNANRQERSQTFTICR